MSLLLTFALSVAQVAGGGAPPVDAPLSPVPGNCTARKFETRVAIMSSGKKRFKKVTLCGTPGQTDTDWAKTLRDAIAKVEANADMPADVRQQIVAAIDAELIKLGPQAQAPAPAPPPIVDTAPSAAAAAPPVLAPIARAPAPAPKPRITLLCSVPGDLARPAPCRSLERETLLTVRADDKIPAGTRLRFLRRGDPRGELALGELSAGQSIRMSLPRQVCAGVAFSRVVIQSIEADAVTGTFGEFALRC